MIVSWSPTKGPKKLSSGVRDYSRYAVREWTNKSRPSESLGTSEYAHCRSMTILLRRFKWLQLLLQVAIILPVS